MERYESFIFEDVTFRPHGRKIVLRYSLDRSITFEETLLLPDKPIDPDAEKREDIQRTLEALLLIGGVSYFKTCCPRIMFTKGGPLSKADASFWNTVYTKGLGQFFYENKMDFRNLVNFPSTPKKKVAVTGLRAMKAKKPIKRVLVPIGGGKDSMVTIELLRSSGIDVTLLRLGTHPLIDELALIAGLPILHVKRNLPSVLFDLNEQGALNGHVPITAYLSILSVLLAQLYGFDAVVMSNEASANEGNVYFNGLEVNHQWSKSLEFERMLRSYLVTSLDANVEYFSLLRPFSELKISEIFSRYPQYLSHFKSCNANWKLLGPASSSQKGLWCNRCPKCAFVFTALSAFIEKKRLVEIFSKNLFEDAELLPLFKELLGTLNFKPFECVGTPHETKAALLLARKKGEYVDTPVMKLFEKEILPTIKDPEGLIRESLEPTSEHCIPKELAEGILKQGGA